MRELAIGLFVDSIFAQIPSQILNSPSGQKVNRSLTKTNLNIMSKNKVIFDDVIMIVTNSWKEIQGSTHMEVSVALIAETLIEREPWLIKKYKLNTKHLNKVFSRFNKKGNIFQSKKAVTLMLNKIDENIAQYNYRNKHV